MVDAPLFHSFIEDISSDVPSNCTPCCMLFYKTLEQEAVQADCDMAGWLCRLEGSGWPPACHPSAPREARLCNSELPTDACAIHCLTAEGGWSRLEAAVRFAQPCLKVSWADTLSTEDE